MKKPPPMAGATVPPASKSTAEIIKADEGGPDELVPDPTLCKELGISAMSLWRWDRDPELIALGLPQPIVIRKRKFRFRRQIEAFKQAMFRRSIAQRGQLNAASQAATISNNV